MGGAAAPAWWRAHAWPLSRSSRSPLQPAARRRPRPVKSGGELRLGTDTGIDSLNPFVAQNTDSFSAFEYAYPELVQYDAQLHFVPDFATSWQTSADGLTWTFHTHGNGKWSDGQPLTAADAAWTINTVLKYGSGSTASLATLLAHVKRATAPDSTTLVIHYTRPVANVLSQLQQLPILPQHVWGKLAVGSGSAIRTFQNNAPVVSGGPFAHHQVRKERHHSLQAQPLLLWLETPHRGVRRRAVQQR